MFSYDEIQKYNETDMLIYRYIISNAEKVPYMTIRELAGEIHTSPGAILRFCSKNSFQGYAELKEALRRQNQTLQRSLPSSDLQELSAFFERTNCSAFEEKLAPAVSIIRQAEPVLFAGKGSSGTLARYGARYFSNLGKFSVGLEDTCYPVETYCCQNAAAIILSESGETGEVIELARHLQQKGSSVLSITNSSLSTLARMSDWNFSYHFAHQRINGNYNATTQVPVLFVLEALGRRTCLQDPRS